MRRTLSVLLVAALVLAVTPFVPMETGSVASAAANDDIPGVRLPWPGITRSMTGPLADDVYAITLLEGTQFSADIRYLSGGLNADLYLWKPGTPTVIAANPGYNLANAVDISATPGSADEHITYTVPPGQGGVYYLDVYGAGGSGAYTLFWDAPNDLPGVAPSQNGSYFSQQQGVEKGVDEADVFSVRLNPGDRLQVYLYAHDPDRNMSLELHDPTATTIWSIFSFPIAESDGISYPEALSYTTPAGKGGYYHIAVKPDQNNYIAYWLRWEVIPAGSEPSVRVSGADRIKTAVQASQEAFPNGSDSVIIVTGYNWPDALSAAGLAGVLHCPILLTTPNSLSPDTATEISNLAARRAYVIGGPSAVAQQVEGEIAARLGPPGTVTRIAGSDRYQTSYNVAAEMDKLAPYGLWMDYFVATGANFPDALAAGAIAADYNFPMPILLVPPGDSLSGAASQAISSLYAPPSAGYAYIVGGQDVVSTGIENDIKNLFVTSGTRRLAGADRYATADAVIRWFSQNEPERLDTIALALGTNYPDALCAASLQATSDSYLLLTPTNGLPAVTRNFLQQNKQHIGTVRVVGGSDVVSDGVMNDAVNLVK